MIEDVKPKHKIENYFNNDIQDMDIRKYVKYLVVKKSISRDIRDLKY